MNLNTLLKKYQANECSLEEQEMINDYIICVGITPQDQLIMQLGIDDLRLRFFGANIKTTKVIPLLRIPVLAATITILLNTGVISNLISCLSFSTSLNWCVSVRRTKLIEETHFEVKEKRKQELLGTEDTGCQDKEITPKSFGGMMYRSQKFADESSVFEASGEVHFTVEGRGKQ